MKEPPILSSLPPEEAAKLLKSASLLEPLLEAEGHASLVALALNLFVEAEAQRWRANRLLTDAQDEKLRQEAIGRRRAASTNNQRHAESLALRREVFDEWKAWCNDPDTHPAGKGRQAKFIKWLGDKFDAVEDVGTFGKWIKEWKERAAEHAKFLEWVESQGGKRPPR